MLYTPFHQWHADHNGRLVDFAGWEMPVQYTTIVDEHHGVRQRAGLFDVAHMGRIRFSGPDAADCLDYLVTNDVSRMPIGRIRYALIVNPEGGVLDDVLVYRLEDHYLLVVNASNRVRILDWIAEHQTPFQVTVDDITATHAMLAVQGPLAAELLDPLCTQDLDSLKYYTGITTEVLGQQGLVSRTGYTGEDGFEVITDPTTACSLWEALIEREAIPAGLGCRDTLRLEAGMPLYGHELTEHIDPLTAGLKFAVKLESADFIGRESLRHIHEQPRTLRRVGLELQSRRIAREGSQILLDANPIGHVSSGTFSPTLEKPIAMGYISADQAQADTAVSIDIRGKPVPATVVPLPFYRRR
jgi:aminomethyltransferase